MTIQQYKQQLYDACKEHSFFAQQALDRYDAATTDQEREQARIDNIQHLAACHALQWALDKAIDFEQQLKQAQIDVLNELKERIETLNWPTVSIILASIGCSMAAMTDRVHRKSPAAVLSCHTTFWMR